MKKILEDFEPKATHKKTEAMKKQAYMKPAMRVVKIQHAQMLCTSGNSGYEVIGTDPPNIPAGASQFNGGFDWDDWDEEQSQRESDLWASPEKHYARKSL